MNIAGQLWNSRLLLSHSRALCPIRNSSSSTNRHHSAQQPQRFNPSQLLTPDSIKPLQHCCRSLEETIAASCRATAETQHSSTAVAADCREAEEHAAHQQQQRQQPQQQRQQQRQQRQQNGSDLLGVPTHGDGLQQQSDSDLHAETYQQQQPAEQQQQQEEEETEIGDLQESPAHPQQPQQQQQQQLVHQQQKQQQQQQQKQPKHKQQLRPWEEQHALKQQRQQEQRNQHRQDIAGHLAALQQQLQQVTHWRHLLPLSANIQYESELLLLLETAMQLQPTAAAAGAPDKATAALSASQLRYEQQQYQRYMQYLVASATRLLLTAGKVPEAAAAVAAAAASVAIDTASAVATAPYAAAKAEAAVLAASAAKRQVLLKLLQLLVCMDPTLQQQLHKQLYRLPVAAVIQQQLQHMQPKQCVQLAMHLAALKPHVQPLPLQLHQQLFAAALAPTYRKHENALQQQQQQQQQQWPSVSTASRLLWAAAKLGWQPEQQHLQQVVRALLQQLSWCTGQQLAMAIWGAARLGSTASQLQQWWVELARAAPGQQQGQQQGPGQMSKVLSAALVRHASHFTASELVDVTWAAAELQLLSDSGLLRVLLQELVQPRALMQLTDLDISSVLRSLALLSLKRAGTVQGRRPRQQQQQQGQRQAGVPAAGHQQEAIDLRGQQQERSVSGGLLLQLSSVGAMNKQQWQQQQQHWSGTTGTADQQQQQQLLQQQDKHQLQPGVQSDHSQVSLEAAQQQQAQHDQEQKLQYQQQQKQRQHQAAAHAQRLAQPDPIPPSLVQPLLQAYYIILPTCSSRCIAETLWSVSVLRVLPAREWMVGVLLQLQAQLAGGLGSGGALDGKSCMLVAFALSRLRYLPDSRWLDGFWRTCLPLIPQHQHQHQQQQRVEQFGASVTTTSSSSSSSRQDRVPFTQAELTVLAASAYELSLLSRPHHRGPWKGQKPPGEWLDAVAAASLGYLSPKVDLRTLLLWGEVMMRFSSMAGEPWPGPGAAWWQGFEAATEPYLQAAEPRELLRLGKMLSTQRQHKPVGQGWVEAFLRATKASCLGATALGVRSGQGDARPVLSRPGTGNDKSVAAAAAAAAAGAIGAGAKGAAAGSISRSQPLSARNLANLGKAVAALGVCPDREWLDAWELALELTGAGMTVEVGNSLQQTRAAFARLADGKQ